MSSNLVEDETQQHSSETIEEEEEEFPSYDPECLTHAYQELLPPKCQKNDKSDYIQPSTCSEVNPLSNNKLIPPCDLIQNEGLCHVTDSQREAINSVGQCEEYCNSFNEDYNETKSVMCDSCNCYRSGSLNSGPEEEEVDQQKKQNKNQKNEKLKDTSSHDDQTLIQQSPLAKSDKKRDSSVFRAWMIMLFTITLLIVSLAFYQTSSISGQS